MTTLPPPLTSPPWTSRTKRLIAVVVLVVVALAVLRLSAILPIIGVGTILAYLLTPMVNFFEQRFLKLGPLARFSNRGWAVGLAYVVIITMVVVVILVVVPVLVAQLEEFGRRIPALLQSVERSLEQSLSYPLMFNGEAILINNEPFIPLDRLRQVTGVEHLSEMIQLSDFDPVQTTQSFIGSLTGPAFDFVGGALTAIINTIFLLSMMFFLMRDGAQIVERGVQLLPSLYRGDTRRLLYELGRVWHAYLRGQLTLALFMGFLAFTVATVLGLPNPLILGMISMLLEFIPSIGSGLAIFPAALLALTSQSSTFPLLEGTGFALMVIVVWAIMQNVEAYILVPRVMGGSLNLHPLAVILAILAGASLAGVLGIVLAAPVVASLRIFGQYIYGKLMDRDPFPAPVIRRDRPSPLRQRIQRVLTAAHEEWNTRIGLQIREWLSARRNNS